MAQPSEEPFAIDVTPVGDDVQLVAITGELDFGEAPELARTLEQLRDDGARWFVLDLAELTFIDSSGINSLVVAARATAAAGGSLIVTRARQHVQRVFDIVKLSEFVPVEAGLDEALQRVSWRRGLTAG
jgi:stage II sporulation protein AA (anti-sigma F factor antagonist)